MLRLDEHEIQFTLGMCQDFDFEGYFDGEETRQVTEFFPDQLPGLEYYEGRESGWHDAGWDLVKMRYRKPGQQQYERVLTFRDIASDK